MLSTVETLQLKLAIRDELDAKGLHLPAAAIAGLTKFYIERGEVITFGEDGRISCLAESLGNSIDAVRYSRDGASYFSTVESGAGAGNGVKHSDNQAAETLLEKSARISGLTVEEFNKKDPLFKHAAADEAKGDTGYVWHGEVKTAPYAGMDPKTLASMSLEDRLAVANEAHFKAAEARKPGRQS